MLVLAHIKLVLCVLECAHEIENTVFVPKLVLKIAGKLRIQLLYLEDFNSFSEVDKGKIKTRGFSRK